MAISLRIGFLQLFPLQAHESGIARYGRYIAQAVQKQPDIETHEVVLELSEEQDFRRDLKDVLKTLQDCDVLHVQYSKYIGLTGWKKLRLFKMIRREFKGKLCITLHDIYSHLYPDYDVREAWRVENKRWRSYSNNQSLALKSTATCLWQDYLPDRAIMQWMFAHGDQLFVCNRTEADRLKHIKGAEKLTVIPHFVEERASLVSVMEAKEKLNLGVDTILMLQGFIYRSKGHALLLDALSLLSQSIKVVFAGGFAPLQESFQQELFAKVEKFDLGDRIEITGYLSDDDLELYLAAADLAICPFQSLSASGSLSTWLSIGRPILASALPQVEELNNMVPGAISTFEDYTPESLAKAIECCLSENDDPIKLQSRIEKVKALQQQLSVTRIAEKHEQQYRLTKK